MSVDVSGNVIDSGCSARSVYPEVTALHAALYAARPDINCAFFITNPLAVSVKCLMSSLLKMCFQLSKLKNRHLIQLHLFDVSFYVSLIQNFWIAPNSKIAFNFLLLISKYFESIDLF